jgi:hypothetical protein
MGMAEAGATATDRQDRSEEDSSHQASPPSAAPEQLSDSRNAAGVGKATIIAAVIALLIGVVCGFTMSTVGLR